MERGIRKMVKKTMSDMYRNTNQEALCNRPVDTRNRDIPRLLQRNEEQSRSYRPSTEQESADGNSGRSTQDKES